MIRSSTLECSHHEPVEAGSSTGGKRSLENACVPLDRSPAALALAIILFVTVMVAALASAFAAEEATAGFGRCTLLSLGDASAAASGGAPVALAEITICYRPLPGGLITTAPVLDAGLRLPVATTQAPR